MTVPSSLFEQVESSLSNAYALKRELGGGGMSHVFLAEERSLGRDVVVKVLRPDLAAGVSADRFTREVRLAAGLQQANIVPLLAAGEAAGLPYYTMPFVPGESLRALLDAQPQLPLAQVVSIATDVAKALAYAHAKGVVHRDIKPENILLSGGTAVVTDFGIAKAIHASRTLAPFETLTQVGTSLGTPAYMSPEQAMGDPTTDHRADLYSLGVTLYEMLAGARPFTQRTLSELVRAHVMQAPVPIEQHRPDVPPALVALVASCLAKSAADRPADANVVLDQLARSAGAISAPSSEAVVTPASVIPTPPAVSRSSRRSPRIAAGVTVVALLAAGGVAIALHSSHAVVKQAVSVEPGRVMIATPVSSGDTRLTATAASTAEALSRALGELSSIRSADIVAGDTSIAKTVDQARTMHAQTVLLGAVEQRGPDSATLRFRLVDADSGVLVRALAPLTLARGASDSTLRSALEPVLSTLAIAAYPALGPAALPLGAPPRLSAVRELITGIGEAVSPDPPTNADGRLHVRKAVELDPLYLQARLWQAYYIQRSLTAIYSTQSRTIGDSLTTEMRPRLDRLSPLERRLLDVVEGWHAGKIPQVIASMKAMRDIAPNTVSATGIALVLLDQNRPKEALALLQSARADRDVNGVLVPPADDIGRWRVIAQIQHALHDSKAEIEAANQQRRLRPDELLAVRAQLVSQVWSGDSVAIERLLADAAQMRDTPGTYDFYGDVALATGQELIAHGHPRLGESLIQRAIVWFENRPTPDPDKYVQLRKALAYHAARNEAAASRALEPLLALDPTSSLYIGLAGRIAAARGDTVQALRLARQMAMPRPGAVVSTDQQERAFIAANLGRRDEAVTLLQEAFANGLGWGIWWRLHWFNDLLSLRGYQPFEKLLQPQG